MPKGDANSLVAGLSDDSAGVPKGDANSFGAGSSDDRAAEAVVEGEVVGLLNKLAEVIEGKADAPDVAGFASVLEVFAEGPRKLKVDFFSLGSVGLDWPKA